ncbi:vesicle-associated membrane protein-associated protein B-like [Oscarella lobularis]|uniref:vesicle-associated membrane protein-associated protein B-like n=1 Tax=Oscarella lobularis TaxID=121494 RepID=UPI003313FACC
MSRDSLLEIDPPLDLKFKGPFTEVSTATLKLSNPTTKPINFKVKTTAPKQYCVRPNAGAVQPGGSVEVQVMLQPNDFDVTKAVRHKFMVQAVFAPSDGKESEDLWKSSAVHDTKLRCSFDVTGSDSPMPQQTTTAMTTTTTTTPNTSLATDPTPPKTVKDVPISSPSPVANAPNTNAKHTPLPSAFEAFQTATGKSERDVQQKELQSKVETLKKINQELEKENSTLRQRKAEIRPGAGETRTASVAAPSPAEEGGLPTPVLVLLALIIGLIIGKLLF